MNVQSDNGSEETLPDPWLTKLSTAELVAWCLPCGMVALAATLGNSLVLASFFMSTNLRNHVNFFVAGLATADVLVGLISIPMWIYMLFLTWEGQQDTTDSTLTLIYDSLDVFAALNSIFHLTAISIERFFATVYPWRHRKATKRLYRSLLIGIWVTSALVSVSFFLPKGQLSIKFRFYLINLLFFIPLAIIFGAYCGIWFKARRRLGMRQKKVPDATIKMSMTLFIVIGLFVVAWLPFFVIRAVLSFCMRFCVSWRIFYVTKLLHFSNSAVNPLVYGFRVPEYKVIFFRLLGLKCPMPKRDSIELESLAVGNSPRSFVPLTNGDLHADNRHIDDKRYSSAGDDNTSRRSSLPLITKPLTHEVVVRSKSQNALFSGHEI